MLMALSVLKVLPAVAALAQEDVGVRGVKDGLDVEVLDPAVATSP